MSNLFYREEKNALVCTLCRHYCALTEGKTGICGVNKHTGEKIECLVYGHPAALNIDPVEKKPLYHVLPSTTTFSLGTVGCNFACPFCQNWHISQNHTIDTFHDYSPKSIVDAAVSKGCRSISFTYNEPTIFYPYARDIALIAKKRGLNTFFVSNGFESFEVIEDMRGIIDAANIDLKSFNPAYYKKTLKGDLNAILENLIHFKKNGIWIEVTTLIIPTKNDSDEELTQIATFINDSLGSETPWHISAFHPDYKENTLEYTKIETLQRAYEIGKKAGLHYIYMGNVGVQNPTLCKKCGALLIERDHFQSETVHLQKNRCLECGEMLEGLF